MRYIYSILFYIILCISGLFLLYISPYSVNYSLYSIMGNLIFWSSLVLLLIKSFLKSSFNLILRNFSKTTLGIFLGYLSVHYFVYSIALERILTGIYGQLFSVNSAFASLSVTPFYPASLYSTIVNLLFNPTITIGFPPNYYIALSFYAIAMGFIIATLVTANILRVLHISKILTKTKIILLVPLLGVIGGGSCCISIPILLATAIPAANVLFFTSIGNSALFLVYILLPPLTAIGLKFNYDALSPKSPKEFRIKGFEYKKQA
ncbi:hypothetical protein DFR86_03905 [Acidianus sulfidivorans JP7]|uniref:Uncharacterized protein n=1 Tax=Acidianus sulfidivorans JP7 TaxID=619593 RepID=A0A2U9ILI9_9CREN|nr:hypothetical protein [Acidianus sulfidivorans]AWR96784.1 hypothetical protein DFR86_03905 [Acidianus sulfidivorans JP7]